MVHYLAIIYICMYVCIYIYIYIYIHKKELGASKRQIFWLVSTSGRFQGNLFEIVEIVNITN